MLAKTGRAEEALTVSKQAVEHFEQAGDQSNAARALIPATRILRDRGDYDNAARLFRDELRLAEQAKDDGGIALAAQGLGAVLLLQEHYPAALASFDRSAQVNHALGNLNDEAYSQENRADALRSLGRYKEAEEALETAERLDQKLNGLKPLLASINFSRAEMDLSRSRPAEAEQDIRKMTEASSAGPAVASEERLLGLQRLAAGRTREGLALCEQAVELSKTFGDVSLLRNSELALAEARLSSGDARGALTLASNLAKYFGEKGQPESEFKAEAVAISASRGPVRERYTANAKSSLAKLRQEFGEAFAGFASRPDIHQRIVRAGLTSGVQ